jgi:hypothetical protein
MWRTTWSSPSATYHPGALAVLLRRHRADDSVNGAIGRLIRADLIVIDDIGMLPVAPSAAEALFLRPQGSASTARLSRSDGRRRGETDDR